MSESAHALRFAHKVLDNDSLDPDGDLCVLARQLLRAHERQDRVVAALRAAVVANLTHTAYTSEGGDIAEAIVDGTAEIPIGATVPTWVMEAVKVLRATRP